jgi:hypothetical protein
MTAQVQENIPAIRFFQMPEQLHPKQNESRTFAMVARQ